MLKFHKLQLNVNEGTCFNKKTKKPHGMGMALITYGQTNWGTTTRQHEWKTLMSINVPCVLGNALTTKQHYLIWDGNETIAETELW